ncbi:sensor histidine kinase [Citreimonas salinaria]|uniref:histidine kinase n=1 Tax=Citreimonas salinaria TaxID=321339 RepID=A0A1H3H9E7_9RHOB|nr:PAS domain S-box protein [Citreimonas salinaria]SDY11404.1 PAS domain S-box-containing protein [Citreimonas salinaria]
MTENSKELVRLGSGQTIDSVLAFIGLLTPEGRLLEVNDPVLAVSGIQRSDVVGQLFWDCDWWTYDQTVREQVRDAVQRARAGQTVRYDTGVRVADGTLLDIDFQIAPYRDTNGDLIALIPSAVDISGRRAVERALRASSQALHDVVRHAPFGVILVGGDFRIELVSAGAEKALAGEMPIIGRDLGAVMRQAWAEPFASEVVDIYRRVLETGEPYATPGMAERRTGGTFEAYDWRVERITTADGRPGLVCYFYDLSERDRIEAALIRSETMFRATFENAAIGMAHVARDGSWLRVNSKLCEIAGYSKAELERGRFQDITAPEDLDGDLECMQEILDGRRDEYAMEKRYVRGDGTQVWINLTVGCVRDNAGEVEYLIACVEDISAQKKADAHRQILVEELNHRVKNILSTVLSVSSQTIRASRDLEDFRSRFGGRLQAISRTHDSIFDSDGGIAQLHDLIEGQFETYVSEVGRRIRASGPPVALNAAQANAVGLLVHELLTNAMKYGALASEDGHIDITWRTRSGERSATEVDLVWVESGARDVTEPTHTGFGTKLIETTVVRTLGGTLERDYRRDGLRCSMTLQISRHDETDESAHRLG